MKIEAGKKYKTRDGGTVEVFATDGFKEHWSGRELAPITGRYTCVNNLYQDAFTFYEGGRFMKKGEHVFDMVQEIPQEKPKETGADLLTDMLVEAYARIAELGAELETLKKAKR